MTRAKAVMTKRLTQKQTVNILGNAGRVEKAEIQPETVTIPTPKSVELPKKTAKKRKTAKK